MTRAEAVSSGYDNIVTGSMFHWQRMALLCAKQGPLSDQKSEEIRHLLGCSAAHFDAAVEALSITDQRTD